MSHKQAMPRRIIRPCIVSGVKPHELIDRLVRRDGGALAVAKAMGKAGFQPTLHKFCAGLVAEPSHITAKRIADHYKLPVEAIYSERVATEESRRLLGDIPVMPDAPVPADPAPAADAPADWPFARITRDMWANLSERQRGAIEAAAVQAWRDLQNDLSAARPHLVEVSERRAVR